MTTIHGRVPFNALANTLNTVLNVLAGLLTLPFLINRLGAATYGVWALIVAVMGYFLFFGYGFGGAVGRLVAGKRSSKDMEGINSVVSTALLASLPICGVVALATNAVSIPFFWLFAVPAWQAEDVRMALLLVGLATVLSLFGCIFSALLWGYERFDLQNLVEIPVVLLRTALILTFIGPESTLLDLAMIIAGATAAGLVVRVCLCWIAEPRLSLRLRYWSRPILSEIFVFGSWFGLLTLSRSRLQNLASFVVGSLLGTVAVTTFIIPKLLTSYSNLFVESATEVVAPHAAAFHFGQQHSEQRKLFLEGGRYSLALSLYFLGGFAFLGLPFLNLWQPGDQSDEYHLLMILLIGEILPLSQWVTYSAIVGIGKHRRLALLALCEGLCILGLSYLSVGRFGLVGAAVAVAASGALFRGLLQWIYGCQLVEISLREYLRKVFLPITLVAAMPILALLALRLSYNPATWLEFCLSGVVYTLAYWFALLLTLLGWHDSSLLALSAFASARGGLQGMYRTKQPSQPIGGRRTRPSAPAPSDESERP